MTYQVGYFVGSLSSTSINRRLSQALIALAPDDMEFTEIPIGDLRSTARTSTPTTRRRRERSRTRSAPRRRSCS